MEKQATDRWADPYPWPFPFWVLNLPDLKHHAAVHACVAAFMPYGGRIVEFDPDGVEKKIGVSLPRCDLYQVEDPMQGRRSRWSPWVSPAQKHRSCPIPPFCPAR